MSMRKILLGVAAGAVGLSALLFSRGKESSDGSASGAGKQKSWVRSTRLAEGVDHPLGLAVDGDHLYFVSGGFVRAENAVRRVPTAGGPVETLVKIGTLIGGELAVDATHVYFTSDGDNAILRVSKSGGEATQLAKVAAPKYLALDATHVYFVTLSREDSGGTVQRIAKTGGAPEVLTSGQPGLDSVVLDAQHVYFRSNKGLWKLAKSGGAPQNLLPITGKQNLKRLVADDSHLYFFLETSTSGKFAVARLPKNGGTPETLSPIVDSAGRLALSDSHVYFFRAAGLYDNVLAKVPKAGGEAETVDGAGPNNGYLTVAFGNAYFPDVATIYRVPK